MSAFNELAAELVAEVPITRLQHLFESARDGEDAFTAGGGFCGNNCSGASGSVCGIKCNPPAGAHDVIDREGLLALTEAELKTIRGDLPQLRQAVFNELVPHLDELRKL